ncbi:MAG TPA: hypothetical protein VJ044_20495 [Candidatus Hodarchaeales archaeon]|nr:hypothetical protein [Candidatus Hodarchaeales archaeon]
MTGYVARDTGELTSSGDPEIQFLLENRTTPKKFKSREFARDYLIRRKHYAVDDLLHMYWIDEKESVKRNLYTGEYSEGFAKIGEIWVAKNFWKCEDCEIIYRVYDIPVCSFCGSEFRFNVSVEEVRNSSLLTVYERRQIRKTMV